MLRKFLCVLVLCLVLTGSFVGQALAQEFWKNYIVAATTEVTTIVLPWPAFIIMKNETGSGTVFVAFEPTVAATAAASHPIVAGESFSSSPIPVQWISLITATATTATVHIQAFNAAAVKNQ